MMDVFRWYKNNPDDKIWWKDTSEKCIGEWVFSFDKKTEFNMFRDYPHALTSEQKKIFDEENPYWKTFFMDIFKILQENLKEYKNIDFCRKMI